ncbi:MAG: hypothetical protein JRJ29_03785 [Deltaproteobacteria bacterium]|nr:hypothetical protein [Deltaproteobacteria bacterium]
MESLQPKGERVKKAIKWISDTRAHEQEASLSGLIQRACLKFNLSPKEEEFLRNFYEQAGR